MLSCSREEGYAPWLERLWRCMKDIVSRLVDTWELRVRYLQILGALWNCKIVSTLFQTLVSQMLTCIQIDFTSPWRNYNHLRYCERDSWRWDWHTVSVIRREDQKARIKRYYSQFIKLLTYSLEQPLFLEFVFLSQPFFDPLIFRGIVFRVAQSKDETDKLPAASRGVSPTIFQIRVKEIATLRDIRRVTDF